MLLKRHSTLYLMTACRTLTRKGIKKADLARSLGTSWPVVSHMEDLHHWTTLRQLDKTAAILGKRLVVSFEDNRIK